MPVCYRPGATLQTTVRVNVYAAGALALSAGLSVHTFYSLPRGGVAGAWQVTPGGTSALRDAPAPRARGRARSRLSELVSGAAAAWLRAPAPSGAASRQPSARRASVFASRPAAPAPRPVERPRVDGTTLLRAGAGPERIVGYAGTYAGQEAVQTGRLEGFHWQRPPTLDE